MIFLWIFVPLWNGIFFFRLFRYFSRWWLVNNLIKIELIYYRNVLLTNFYHYIFYSSFGIFFLLHSQHFIDLDPSFDLKVFLLKLFLVDFVLNLIIFVTKDEVSINKYVFTLKSMQLILLTIVNNKIDQSFPFINIYSVWPIYVNDRIMEQQVQLRFIEV